MSVRGWRYRSCSMSMWIEIFTRFLNTLADSPPNFLSHVVFLDNNNLALKGCTSCWPSHVISSATSLGANTPAVSHLSNLHLEPHSSAVALRSNVFALDPLWHRLLWGWIHWCHFFAFMKCGLCSDYNAGRGSPRDRSHFPMRIQTL